MWVWVWACLSLSLSLSLSLTHSLTLSLPPSLPPSFPLPLPLCTRTHSHTCTYIHTYIHTHTRTHTHTHTQTHTGARVDAATLVANSDNDYTRGTVANMVHTSRGRAILQDIIVKLCADFAPVVARSPSGFAFMHSCRHERMCLLSNVFSYRMCSLVRL